MSLCECASIYRSCVGMCGDSCTLFTPWCVFLTFPSFKLWVKNRKYYFVFLCFSVADARFAALPPLRLPARSPSPLVDLFTASK